MNNFSFSPIAHISSCFKEKFSIPRQPGLVTAATAELVLNEPYASAEIVRGLEGFSHIWVIFAFHAVPLGQWKPTVRPPRLGGNQRLGVFATRSTHRPNPIGMSAVNLLDISIEGSEVKLILGGCDLLDGTPVLGVLQQMIVLGLMCDNLLSSYFHWIQGLHTKQGRLVNVFTLRMYMILICAGAISIHLRKLSGY